MLKVCRLFLCTQGNREAEVCQFSYQSKCWAWQGHYCTKVKFFVGLFGNTFSAMLNYFRTDMLQNNNSSALFCTYKITNGHKLVCGQCLLPFLPWASPMCQWLNCS